MNERLRDLAAKGLTQREAARELGVSQKRVSKLAAEFGLSFPPAWSRVKVPTTELGKILQAARFKAGYSYGRLGALTGMQRGHIMAIERGRIRRPREKTLRALADCLQGHASYDELAQAAWAGRPPVSEERLEELAKKGLTRTEAAQEVGVSQKHVSKLASRYGVSFATGWPKPKAPATELGRVLQTARLASGHSFSRLAGLAGLHRRHIIDLERGRIRRPREKTLRALANRLEGHASYDELVRAAHEAAVPARPRARRRKRHQRRSRGDKG